MASISLCMIVKDEEECLARCLDSVKDLVQQAIVVDTGSNDRTAEIAESYGARVIPYIWEKDFSKARNFAISHASCDWILVLDADEVLDIADHARIRGLVDMPDVCYSLTQRHYTNDLQLNCATPCVGEHPEFERDSRGYFDSSLIRLFPNNRGIQYRGIVHELVEQSVDDIPSLRVETPGILLHHYGLSEDADSQERKKVLYAELAAKKVEDEPSNWQAFYELGIERNLSGHPEEAVEAFSKSLQLDPGQLWVWSNLAHTLSRLGRVDQAFEAFQRALAIDPACKEVYSNLAILFYTLNRLADAETVLRKSLTIDQTFLGGWCNLGMVLSKSRKPAAAALAYRRALMLNPSCVTARASLASLHIDAGQHQIALEIVEPILHIEDPHHQLAMLYAGLALKGISRNKEAAEMLDKLLEDTSIQPGVRTIASGALNELAN